MTNIISMALIVVAILSQTNFAHASENSASDAQGLTLIVMKSLKEVGTLNRMEADRSTGFVKTDATYSNQICTLSIEIKNFHKNVKAYFSTPMKTLGKCENQISTYIKKEFRKI